MPEIRLEIPAVPPSGNNYVRHIAKVARNGTAFVQHYVTSAAEDWYWHTKVIAAGRMIRGATYTLSYVVYTKSLVSSDVDNYAKCILDGLALAGVIDNDKKVVDLHGYRRVDRNNPRTLIIVRTEQETLFGGTECK